MSIMGTFINDVTKLGEEGGYHFCDASNKVVGQTLFWVTETEVVKFFEKICDAIYASP